MIYRTPNYYNKFKCIADKCMDNCCIGWEIDIDNSTAEKYRNISGDFGKRLKENISFGESSCFILGEDDRCPFLNNHNLCDIITQLGESALCQICTDHPRFYEWFGNIKEGGIGMSCEEAARIILTEESPFSYMETEISDEEYFNYDEYLYDILFRLRERTINIFNDKTIPLSQCLIDILELTSIQQECMDNDCPLPDDIPKIHAQNGNIADILDFLQTLEPISEEWHPTLARAVEKLSEIATNKDSFLKENPQIEKYLRNIGIYFIWRYLLKGVFDGEFLSRAVLAVVSVCIIAVLWAEKWLSSGLSENDCIEIAKNFSKEIEYSEENLEAVLEAAYELPAMSVSALKDLI